MLDYFLPLYFVYCAKNSLIACRMRPKKATEYIDEFQKCLINCANVSEAKAKFILEMNFADWLCASLLPYNCIDLHAIIFFAR